AAHHTRDRGRPRTRRPAGRSACPEGTDHRPRPPGAGGGTLRRPLWEGRMHTEITFVDGKAADFDETADVKMTPHGVEVLQRDGHEQVRVLFPWARIDVVTQRGINVAANYTYCRISAPAARRTHHMPWRLASLAIP